MRWTIITDIGMTIAHSHAAVIIIRTIPSVRFNDISGDKSTPLSVSVDGTMKVVFRPSFKRKCRHKLDNQQDSNKSGNHDAELLNYEVVQSVKRKLLSH